MKDRALYYFDDAINIIDRDFDRTLLDGKPCNNSLICHVEFEAPHSISFYNVKPLLITFTFD